MAFSLFPSSGIQALIAAIQFLGVTILTFFFSRRVLGEPGSGQTLATLTWPRVCILLVFIDSYFFVFTSGILIFGVGLQTNKTTCAAGIYICVLFYSSSKVLIYAFLTEKVYIVWDTGRPRFRSPVFLVCMATVCLYAAVIIIMIIGRVEQFRPGDGACVIGLKPTASIPLLSYDLFINILLTTMFMGPLLRSKHSTARLRRVATRTLVAAGMALTTSTINISVLTIMKGRQLGWLCLACCGVDVVFNAAALFWVTVAPPPTPLSGNRELSDSRSNSANVASLSNPPYSPARAIFGMKIGMMKPSNSFQMGNLSSKSQEFQIHVTTEVTKSSSTISQTA